MTAREPDFTFQIGIPIFHPSEAEMASMPEPEAYIQALVKAEYLTKEEAYAYLMFSGLASGIPFLMDEFLSEYRASKTKPTE